ncbi:MAG: hypothetical protein M3R04_00310 [bacterium]|nr:hypothetical protein [bacterium]
MNNRLLTVTFIALAGLAFCSPALATSKQNVERFVKHFESLGSVRYKTFAPLGEDLLGTMFPEIGVAEIGEGSASKLVVVRANKGGKGGIETLISEPFVSSGSGADFGLLAAGNHLITYTSQPWTDGRGVEHVRGDLQVRDLTSAGGVKQLFLLKDAVDVGFKIGSQKFQDNLVWQPLLHFLNGGERLPRRFVYNRLAWDEVSSGYKLVHHLTALPEAGTVLAANLNNKGILYYRAGHLREAERWFSEATTQATTEQSIVLHNTELVGVEMEDISRQGRKRPEQVYDEALMAYWRGEFDDALLQLSSRGASIGEFDYALLGLALAQQRRWPEVDGVTERLARKSLSPSGRGKQFYADYLGEVARIALLQGRRMNEVAGRYLKALEATDKGHPAYVEGIAELMVRGGQTAEVESMLERQIDLAPGDVDLMRYFTKLFTLYQSSGRSTSMLLADASEGPLHNIGGYVDMLDYYDLRPALTDLQYQGENTIDVSGGPLDSFGLPDARQNNEPPKMEQINEVFEGGVVKGESSDLVQ